MRDYVRQHFMTLLFILILWSSTIVYVTYLTPVSIALEDLLYLNILLVILFLCFIGIDLYLFHKKKRDALRLREGGEYIFQEDLPTYVLKDVWVHNDACYVKDLQEAVEKQKDLQEYISRWSHEIKLPLAALRMMNERNQDSELRNSMFEQCEKMEQLLHTMLTGCKTWDTNYDKVIQEVSLIDVVKQSIRHQSYFLIKEHFIIENEVGDCKVLSDPQWLVYMLDQIIANAVKYHGDIRKLHIWAEVKGTTTSLHIKDYGTGIRSEDLPSVFDKGYTGVNKRNGEYKSTGMGLYFVKVIADMLGHTITIDTKVNAYTDVMITLYNHLDYFNLTEQ